MRVVMRAGKFTVELAPEIGGCVAAFKFSDEFTNINLLRTLRGDDSNVLNAAMFPMVPYANCVRDNTFGLDGRVYSVSPGISGKTLAFHGNGWLLPWSVYESSERHALLRLDGATMDDVYHYDSWQDFALDEDGLTVRIGVTNRGQRRMPFGLGLHPWFPRHGAATLSFSAQGFWKESLDHTAGELVSIPRKASYAAGRSPPRSRQNNCYAGWDRAAIVAWPEHRLSLEMRADRIFPHLMFHVPETGEPVFCAEPQSNAPCGFDGLEAGIVQPGVLLLAPGISAEGEVRFTVRHEAAS